MDRGSDPGHHPGEQWQQLFHLSFGSVWHERLQWYASVPISRNGNIHVTEFRQLGNRDYHAIPPPSDHSVRTSRIEAASDIKMTAARAHSSTCS
jgi:hypothetical protein